MFRKGDRYGFKFEGKQTTSKYEVESTIQNIHVGGTAYPSPDAAQNFRCRSMFARFPGRTKLERYQS